MVAQSDDEAVDVYHSFGMPVAMKVVSPAIVHKTERGGVALNVSSEKAVRTTFRRMARTAPKGAFEGVIISRMVEDPVEAIVGLSTDAQFGPVVAVGLGGVFTEIFRDVVLRVAPVSEEEAQRMIDRLRGVGLLQGARGRVLRDVGALANLVSRISRLPFEFSGLGELDLNPVFLFERGCAAGDARIIPASDCTYGRSD
jgi:acetyltransferase